ncbi:unnamed protein product [Owenia fusiformis]|uniref:Uncharacterized protein n=1 Tax=Owenia fusiformis TaxID=6347 RepID=A0A8J1XKJ6_OWEFU|nr:unnamed protein product [Owenia fusiformis]
MGKIKVLAAVFNNPNAVFKAGETLSGYLQVEFSEPMKIKNIHLLIHGAATVNFREDNDGSGGYSSYHQYVNHPVFLYGNERGESKEAVLHPAGQFKYPFTHKLASDLPSTFEGAYGWVRYFVKATVEIPWHFNQKTTRAFSVVGSLDLNNEPDLLKPIQVESDKEMKFLFFKQGSISATFSLNRRGYVAGEVVQINAAITNNSSRKIKHTRVDFHQQIAYHATWSGLAAGRQKTQWSSHHLAFIKKGEVNAHSTQIWENELIQIPALPPSRLGSCDFIDINYILTLKIRPAGSSTSLQIPIEIVIGTVPLKNLFSPPPSKEREEKAESASRAALAERPLPPYPGNAPPPTYAESVFGSVQFEDYDEDANKQQLFQYTPYYTYYICDNT